MYDFSIGNVEPTAEFSSAELQMIDNNLLHKIFPHNYSYVHNTSDIGKLPLKSDKRQALKKTPKLLSRNELL